MKQTMKLPIAAVVVVALWASYRLMTTLPAFRDCHGCSNPLSFLILLIFGAVTYVVIAIFFGSIAWTGFAALIEAWSKPPPFKEMFWLPIFVAMAVVFAIVTLAWVTEPFIPSVSRYVWGVHFG